MAVDQVVNMSVKVAVSACYTVNSTYCVVCSELDTRRLLKYTST